MKIDTNPFRRGDVTKRQLLAEDPQAAPILDRLEASTVAGFRHVLGTLAAKHRDADNVYTGFTVAAGVAALGAGLFSPWAGVGLAAVAGYLGFQAFTSGARARGAERDLGKVERLAERTYAGLQTTSADGTVVDHRFLDEGFFHSPEEVRRGDGTVVARSVRFERGDQVLTARADVAAGLVTLSGPLGESTFPGTLELPGPMRALKVTRSDGQPAAYEQGRLLITSAGEVEVHTEDGQGQTVGTSYQFQNLGQGVVASWDEQNRLLAVQSPLVDASFTTPDDLPNQVWSEVVEDRLWVRQRVDVPKLELLQGADVTDRMTVAGAEFVPRRSNRLHLSQEDGQVRIGSDVVPEYVVKGQLTEHGELETEQGCGKVAQQLSDLAVRLRVNSGGARVALVHERDELPVAEAFGRPVQVAALEDGSYRVELPSGAITVAPAITLGQLDAR